MFQWLASRIIVINTSSRILPQDSRQELWTRSFIRSSCLWFLSMILVSKCCLDSSSSLLIEISHPHFSLRFQTACQELQTLCLSQLLPLEHLSPHSQNPSSAAPQSRGHRLQDAEGISYNNIPGYSDAIGKGKHAEGRGRQDGIQLARTQAPT